MDGPESCLDFRKNIQNNTHPFDFYLHHRSSCYFTKQATLIAVGHTQRHNDTAHIQANIEQRMIRECHCIVGGCKYNQAACMFVVHHGQNCSLDSLKNCSSEFFLQHFPLNDQIEKREHQLCLLLGFEALKKEIMKLAPRKQLSLTDTKEEPRIFNTLECLFYQGMQAISSTAENYQGALIKKIEAFVEKNVKEELKD